VRTGDLLPFSGSTFLPDEPQRRQQPFEGHAIGTRGTKKQSKGVGNTADGDSSGKAVAQPIRQMSDAASGDSEAQQKQGGTKGRVLDWKYPPH
jgi:hypothetical protein